MTTVACNACSMEIESDTVKCENCKANLSQEKDDWEDDFRFIEEAELKGNVHELESFNEDFSILEQREDIQISQDIKEEPEVHIEPDVIDGEQEIEPDNNADLTSSRQYQCTDCSMCFKRKASLNAHFNAEHYQSDSGSEHQAPKRNPRQSPKKKKSYMSYECEICQKITTDYLEHTKHVQSHKSVTTSLPSGLKKCNDCDKTFSNNFDFKIHKSQHEGKHFPQCDICKAYLSNEIILKRHKTVVHNDNTKSATKYRCEFCGKTFTHQILMINHKKTHAEATKMIEETAIIEKIDRRLTYICKLCGKLSKNKTIHTEHMRVHTKEKPFKCDLCGTGFTAKGSLVQHMRLHSDERPFMCNICGRSYRHKRNLRKHLFKHTGARPFKCEYCSKTFNLRSTKMDHVRLLHTGETPYQCDVCKLWYKTSFLLNAHRRADHQIDTNTKPRVEIINNAVPNGNHEECATICSTYKE